MLALLIGVAALQDKFDHAKKVDHSKMQALIADAEAAEAKAESADKAMKAIPSSLLEKAPAWTSADGQATEQRIAKSYSDLDKVQDELLKAADKELEEQKSLPTLEQATHHWDASKFSAPEASSFIETGSAPREEEYRQAVDFSKLDQLRKKIDGVNLAMEHDVADLKIQTEKDEALAKDVGAKAPGHAALAKDVAKDVFGAKGSLAEQDPSGQMVPVDPSVPSQAGGIDMMDALPSEVITARKPMDADDLADIAEKHERQRQERAAKQAMHARHKEHRQEEMTKMAKAGAKLNNVRSKLALLEQSLSTKASSGDEEAREALNKVKALMMLSNTAGDLVESVGIGHHEPPLQLAQLRAIKNSLASLRMGGHPTELEEHLRALQAHAREHAGSLLQGAPTDDGGYAPIEQGLQSLHQRIEQQVAGLKAQEQKETAAQVNTLAASDPQAGEGLGQFAFAQPSYAEVGTAHMRTH